MSDSVATPDELLADLSDSRLVVRARQGDGAAFELIVRRYNQALFRAARGVLNDEGLAQEVVQEAYLKAFTNLDSFQKRATLKTWLTRIVVNQAISIKRRQHPAASLDGKIAFLHSNSPEGGGMVSHIASNSTPETEAGRQEVKYLLEAAIRRLPEIYRCVFMFREVEGMSVADTAFCLGINKVLVKKRLSRAREMLREELIRRMESEVSGIFEFAGKRCDAVTVNVMAELTRRGMVKQG